MPANSPPEYILGRRAQACLAAEDRIKPPDPDMTPQERKDRKEQREAFYARFIPARELPNLQELAAALRRYRAAYGDAADRIPGSPLAAGKPMTQSLHQLAKAAELVEQACAALAQEMPNLPYGGQQESVQGYWEPRKLPAPTAPAAANPAETAEPAAAANPAAEKERS